MVIFYLLSPIPTLIAKRHSDGINESSALKEACAFFTTGIVLSAFGLPLVLARAPVAAPTVSFTLKKDLHCLNTSCFRLHGHHVDSFSQATLSSFSPSWAFSLLLTTMTDLVTAIGKKAKTPLKLYIFAHHQFFSHEIQKKLAPTYNNRDSHHLPVIQYPYFIFSLIPSENFVVVVAMVKIML